MTDLNKLAATADLNLRRTLAVLSGLLVGIVTYAFLATQFGADAGGNVMWAILLGLSTLLVWYSAQSDNRRAKAANDKTLIVSSFSKDVVTTGLVVICAGAVLAFTSIVPIGVTLGASVASLLAYAVAKHIWERAK